MHVSHITPVTSAILIGAFALGACSGEDPVDTTPADTLPVDSAQPSAGTDASRIDIDRSRFSDERLVVTAGSTVSFVNNDPFAHTVTSVDDSPFAFDSGDLDGGSIFEVTFDDAGEYAYFCEIHPTMRATVIVE